MSHFNDKDPNHLGLIFGEIRQKLGFFVQLKPKLNPRTCLNHHINISKASRPSRRLRFGMYDPSRIGKM